MAYMAVAMTVIGVAVAIILAYMTIAHIRVAMPSMSGLNESVSGNITAGIDGVQTTVFAAFSLLAVGVIVVAAFGLIAAIK